MTLGIRPTTDVDLPHLCAMWNRGDVMGFVGFPEGLGKELDEMPTWLARVEARRPDREHYSLYDGDEYCGEAFYDIDREHGDLATLDIKLLPAARGHGIGAAGLTPAINQAFAHGASRAFVDPNIANSKAIALYERLGFRRVEPPHHIRESWADVDLDVVHLEIDHPVDASPSIPFSEH